MEDFFRVVAHYADGNTEILAFFRYFLDAKEYAQSFKYVHTSVEKGKYTYCTNSTK